MNEPEIKNMYFDFWWHQRFKKNICFQSLFRANVESSCIYPGFPYRQQ